MDAGLTPAQNRWMIRVQARQMSMSNQNALPESSMQTNATVLMLAYGLRPNLTLIGMQGWMNRSMNMMGSSQTTSGSADLNLLLKYRVYRHNTRVHTLGIAATSKLTIPSGYNAFSDGYYSFTPGFYLSYRRENWAFDASATYRIQNLFESSTPENKRGSDINWDGAIAHQFSIGSNRNFAIAPVLEGNLSISKPSQAAHDLVVNKMTVLLLSPGLKVTYSSLILEALIQKPIFENVPSGSMQTDFRARIGFRYML